MIGSLIDKADRDEAQTYIHVRAHLQLSAAFDPKQTKFSLCCASPRAKRTMIVPWHIQFLFTS